MNLPGAQWWNKMPFVHLLFCLIAGIVLQWKFEWPLYLLVGGMVFSFCGLGIYNLMPVRTKFRLATAGGLLLSSAVVFMGASLTRWNDVRHDTQWIGRQYRDSSAVLIKLEEPLSEKAASYKALASIQAVCRNSQWEQPNGKIIVYFKKDTAFRSLQYGQLLVFKNVLQEIKNAGNPGGFDYRQYCLFQGIGQQVYISPGDVITLPAMPVNAFKKFIYATRRWVVSTLKRFIRGEKEHGLAEALLIGYKDDLDKNLVQAYSNTGVVHVIAISGLHLGLIYWILLLLTTSMTRSGLRWGRLLIILSCLWLFSILAGAQPSVLRSAVMFTCIAVGEILSRKTSVYNTLALSAFLLLCYQPFWLWDAGFQLSYAAVLSIIIFFKPIYNWIYFPNKLLDGIWKLNAVTIAAQLLTLPVSIYHFHQAPTLFLFTNIVAVPLSSIILIGELLLCATAFIKPLAFFLGKLLEWLIGLMNRYIERFNELSFCTWGGLSITLMQTLLLTLVIAGFCFWLMYARRVWLWCALLALFPFMIIRSKSFLHAKQQRKLIVYNIPKHSAIDLVSGRTGFFYSDAALRTNDALQNFHLRPARVLMRISTVSNWTEKATEFGGLTILIIDSKWVAGRAQEKKKIDILILAKNPVIYIRDLTAAFSIDQIVIDSSVPAWKSRLWKNDCRSLGIPCHDVKEDGAFVREWREKTIDHGR